jgi:hypothetical protein
MVCGDGLVFQVVGVAGIAVPLFSVVVAREFFVVLLAHTRRE